MKRFALIVACAVCWPVAAQAPVPALSVDEAIVTLATAAAEAHERADRLAATDPLAASEVLKGALAFDFPADPRSSALRADLYAHRSELLLTAKEASAALAAAREGLTEGAGAPPTAFTALLSLREGEALEALGDDAGAVKSYRATIGICKRLLAKEAP